VLFVIAHPDDEAMFFSPTMAHYRRQGWAMWVLCVSTGNGGFGLKGKGERWGGVFGCALVMASHAGTILTHTHVLRHR